MCVGGGISEEVVMDRIDKCRLQARGCVQYHESFIARVGAQFGRCTFSINISGAVWIT